MDMERIFETGHCLWDVRVSWRLFRATGGRVAQSKERGYGIRNRSDTPQYSAERRQLLNQELNRCVRLLTEHESPEKVRVFGTLAKGQVHEWSDIDLVVVERTELPFFQRIKKIRQLLKPTVGMDIMVYTPEEFNQLCADRPFFQEEIVGKGKIVYEHGR